MELMVSHNSQLNIKKTPSLSAWFFFLILKKEEIIAFGAKLSKAHWLHFLRYSRWICACFLCFEIRLTWGTWLHFFWPVFLRFAVFLQSLSTRPTGFFWNNSFNLECPLQNFYFWLFKSSTQKNTLQQKNLSYLNSVIWVRQNQWVVLKKKQKNCYYGHFGWIYYVPLLLWRFSHCYFVNNPRDKTERKIKFWGKLHMIIWMNAQQKVASFEQANV